MIWPKLIPFNPLSDEAAMSVRSLDIRRRIAQERYRALSVAPFNLRAGTQVSNPISANVNGAAPKLRRREMIKAWGEAKRNPRKWHGMRASASFV